MRGTITKRLKKQIKLFSEYDMEADDLYGYNSKRVVRHAPLSFKGLYKEVKKVYKTEKRV